MQLQDDGGGGLGLGAGGGLGCGGGGEKGNDGGKKDPSADKSVQLPQLDVLEVTRVPVVGL